MTINQEPVNIIANTQSINQQMQKSYSDKNP